MTDHDARSIEEVLAKISAAEELLAQARAMLGASQTPKTANTQSVPDSGTTPPANASKSQGADIDPETGLDLNILRHHEPPQPGDSYRAVIIGLFRLVLDTPDEDHLQECLRRYMVSELVASPNSLRNLMRFGWARFTKFHEQYLAEAGDPASFQVVRTQPEVIAEEDTVKVFLYAQGRSPAPVELRKDAALDGAWRIASLSM